MDHATTIQQVEKSATAELLQYGVVGLAVIVFAAVIVHLYKQNRKDLKESHARDTKHEADLAKCQEQCKVEKEAMRADYERKNRETIEGYTHQLTQLRAQQEKREDDIRREMNAMVVKISENAQERDEALLAMLNKFYERIAR